MFNRKDKRDAIMEAIKRAGDVCTILGETPIGTRVIFGKGAQGSDKYPDPWMIDPFCFCNIGDNYMFHEIARDKEVILC